MFGSPAADRGRLERLFPTPAQLANSALERAGVVRARAEAIRALARHVASGSIALGSCIDGRATVSALRSLPGIGDWTAEYIAMRALGEPDAFSRGDRVLRRTAGDLTTLELDRRSEAWRPWRAYAVILLWQRAVDELEGQRVQRNGRAQAHVGAGGRADWAGTCRR
jgi:AraC family transcriptional regulator of adaptative response / DNA-3-methyladenine glycosylase II